MGEYVVGVYVCGLCVWYECVNVYVWWGCIHVV